MAERTMIFPEGTERMTVLGSADRHLKLIREALGVNISARDESVVIRGDDAQVRKAASVIEQLVNAARSRKTLGREQVLDLILAAPDGPVVPAGGDDWAVFDDSVSWEGSLQVFASGRPIRAKTPNQEAYLEAIRTKDLVFGIGPAGTGKTYLAVAAAVHMLKVGRVRKLVLVRPAVEAGERLGFLPGDVAQKVNPYLRPLFDALGDMLDYQTLQRFIANDVVEIVPLAFMRGRTLNDAVIILDEAQNTTVGQMVMFLTRMGRRSKCVVTGDPSQIDLEPGAQSGLVDAAWRLADLSGISMITFNRVDIVRHSLVQRIVEAYGNAELAPITRRLPEPI